MRNSKHPPNPQTDTQRTRCAIRAYLEGAGVVEFDAGLGGPSKMQDAAKLAAGVKGPEHG